MAPSILRSGVSAVCAVALAGCYLHENGMQTPTPTLHGRPAVAYAVPLPPIGRLPRMVYIPAEREQEEAPRAPEAARLPPVPPQRVREFDAPGATAALGAVDLSACKEARAARGYGHVRVTFEPEGHVSDVFVDQPLFWPRSVVACVQDRLSAARVPAFDDDAKRAGAWVLIEME